MSELKWKPKEMVLPLAQMAGAPWNLIDQRGVRIAWAGGPDCDERMSIKYAEDLLNLVAIGEAVGDLHDRATKRIESQEQKLADMQATVQPLVDALEKVSGKLAGWVALNDSHEDRMALKEADEALAAYRKAMGGSGDRK